nr:MAG TPA: hypothetical protein [Caudoviricetes sp.]
MSFSMFSPRSHLIIGHTLGHAYEPTPLLDLWGGCVQFVRFFARIYIYAYSRFSRVYVYIRLFIYLFFIFYINNWTH